MTTYARVLYGSLAENPKEQLMHEDRNALVFFLKR